MPVMVTTEGDPMVFGKVVFDTVDEAALRSALGSHPAGDVLDTGREGSGDVLGAGSDEDAGSAEDPAALSGLGEEGAPVGGDAASGDIRAEREGRYGWTEPAQ
jgi:hypothetical protein